MLFGERLKMLRDEKGINQEEFVKIIGKSRSSVAGYEVGDRVPDSKTLIYIADYFGCTLDYLFGRSEHKNETEKGIVDILSERLGLPTESIEHIMPLFNQFLDIVKLSNSMGVIKEFEMIIEWLRNYVFQSLEDVDLQNSLLNAIASNDEAQVKLYENQISKGRNKNYYFIRLSQSLNRYTDVLQSEYRKSPTIP